MMKPLLGRALAVLVLSALVLSAGLVLGGCTEAAREYVSASAADSAAADRALEEGDVELAREHLRAVAERAVPSGVAEEDARVIRQDAYERWARMEITRGHAGEAERLVGLGLALGERDDVFTANLLAARGRAREALGRDRDAARDYHRALRIQEVLLDRALGGTDE